MIRMLSIVVGLACTVRAFATPDVPADVTTTVDLIAKLIGTLGFPIAVAAFLLWSMPRAIDRLISSQRSLESELTKAINDLRDEVQHLSNIIEYVNRIQGGGSIVPHGWKPPPQNSR